MNKPLENPDGGLASAATNRATGPAVLNSRAALRSTAALQSSAALPSTAALQSSACSPNDVYSWSGGRIRLTDYIELAKPRISVLVLLVTAIGFCLGSNGVIQPGLLLRALLGTALVAIGANVLNQVMEWRYDRLMRRTAGRPIPSGRIRPVDATAFGVACGAIGLALLAFWVNGLAAILAALTIGLYLAAYTPLKRRTVHNTLVGAVPGALPPLIGFAAASGGLDITAWFVFLILLIWQLPHFFAIAWMYRDDYARGGYRMISTDDADGSRTGRAIVAYSVVLLVASVVPAWLGTSGMAYGIGAAALGIALLGVGVHVARQRTVAAARLMLIASVIYIPALLILMLFDQVRS